MIVKKHVACTPFDAGIPPKAASPDYDVEWDPGADEAIYMKPQPEHLQLQAKSRMVQTPADNRINANNAAIDACC